MIKRTTAKQRHRKRHQRVRVRISGTATRPRLNVFRSARYIHAQLIDDTVGHTLAAASSLDPSIRDESGTKTDQARLVGKLMGQRALERGIQQVVFDRGGYKYHGRVKALAEGAREAGLEF
ncbi:MAG: 50S ribosomal protein L18 [Chloroflexia bacterium]|nr:50S ribosomal protein L18 [Chloroflexia bacterium]